ncbi:ATP-binding protein [Chitinibacter sp. SCUT-21]|uniref:ATP-binding protein n=1 Tax=Chitinibacter sp. SCUT-21 TaxID=2970891 RepID=UPI0035A6A607
MSHLPISAPLQIELDKIIKLTNSDRYEAFNYCEAGFAAARAAHDDAAFIAIAIQYGLVIDQHGYPQESIDILYEALQLAQSYHQFSDEARLLNVIGRAVYTRAEYRRAMQAWAHCLEVANLAGDNISWIWAKVGIAQIYDALDDNDTAVILLKQAEERARPLGDPILLLNIMLNLGVDLFHLRRFQQALDSYQESLQLARTLNHLDDIGETLFRIAEVELELDHLDTALDLLKEAQEICSQSHHMWALANIHGVRAKILQLRQQHDQALEEVQQGLDYACASSSTHIQMRLLYLQAKIAESSQKISLAYSSFQLATEIKGKINPTDYRQQLAELEDLAGLRPSPGRVLLDLANSRDLDHCNLPFLAQTLCEHAAKIIRQVQASYWEYQPGDGTFCQLFPDKQAEKITLNDRLILSLRRGETTVAHNAQHHQHTWDLYEKLWLFKKTISLLIIPLRLNESIYGILMIEYSERSKNWSSDEIQYMNQLAMIGTRVLLNIERDVFQADVARLNAQLQESNVELEARVLQRTLELQKAMEHLIEAEKLASLGNLVAGFAHELNTPLGNTLTASSTLLDKNKELMESINAGVMKKSILLQYLNESTMIAELVERNARRASNLISNLKQVAVDTASGKRRLFNLNTVVEETIATLSMNLRRRHIRVTNLIDSKIELNSYPGSLEQIISNLINNSLVHGFGENEEGEIVIEAYKINENKIELHYKDSGAGIPDTIKKRVFEPFFTTRFGQGGSGLGLYLVYSLVTGTLGGMLELRDPPLHGVWFVLTLPIEAPAEHHEKVDIFRH